MVRGYARIEYAYYGTAKGNMSDWNQTSGIMGRVLRLNRGHNYVEIGDMTLFNFEKNRCIYDRCMAQDFRRWASGYDSVENVWGRLKVRRQ